MHCRDSAQIITPFVRGGTYPTRNFATLGPVSYTHLDVYKRQVHKIIVVLEEILNVISSKSVNHTAVEGIASHDPVQLVSGKLTTVSYTHLDVYKRQLRPC